MYEGNDSLSRMEGDLYSRKNRENRGDSADGQDQDGLGESEGRAVPSNSTTDWDYEETDREESFEEKLDEKKRRKREEAREKLRPKLKTFFITSLVILLCVGGFALYRFFVASGLVSTGRIELVVDGPSSVRGGDDMTLEIDVANRNEASLLSAELVLDFPREAAVYNEDGEEVRTIRRDIGDVVANGRLQEEFTFSLFAKEGSEVPIEITLEFATASASTRVNKNIEHAVRIGESPIAFTVEPSLDELQPGDEFIIEIEARSNSTETTEDLMITLDVPTGFILTSSDPKPPEEYLWEIDELAPEESETITLTGYFDSSVGEELFFNATLGQGSGGGEVSRIYGKARTSVALIEPPVRLRTSINGNSSATVSMSPEGEVDLDISWQNTLDVPIRNLSITAEIDGSYVDENSISSNGFYRSNSDTFVWNTSTNDAFFEVGAHEEGSVSASFDLRGLDELGSSNSEFPIRITAAAEEPTGEVSRRISGETEKIIRLASTIDLLSGVQHDGGLFSNSGPTPPEVDRETTYTIDWSIRNSGNDVEDVTVRAALPANVTFIQASSEDVRYSELSNEIIWSAGDVGADGGFGGGERVSIQVGIVPSQTQAGSQPVVMYSAVLEGRDAFTGVLLRDVEKELTTPSNVVE